MGRNNLARLLHTREELSIEYPIYFPMGLSVNVPCKLKSTHSFLPTVYESERARARTRGIRDRRCRGTMGAQLLLHILHFLLLCAHAHARARDGHLHCRHCRHWCSRTQARSMGARKKKMMSLGTEAEAMRTALPCSAAAGSLRAPSSAPRRAESTLLL